jgi:hypothetical protein
VRGDEVPEMAMPSENNVRQLVNAMSGKLPLGFDH